MFERFTERAIKAMMLAQEESKRLGYNYVGTEQILLGLISEETSIAAKTLKSMGVTLDKARIEVEKIIGKGSDFVEVEIPFTQKAKNVLGLAWHESYELEHNCVAPEHLFLALIKEKDGIALKVLKNLEVDINQAVDLVLEELKIDKTRYKKRKKLKLDLLKFSLVLQIILIILSITLIVLKCLYK